MARGNPDNLRAAAQRKRQAATQRAETALDALIASDEPITFRGLSKTAGVSIDFLYRSPLRARVERLRAAQQRTPPASRAPEIEQPPSQSNVVRALTGQLGELKRHHRAEIAGLEAALAAAQGENLELRRRLGRSPSANRPPELSERDHDTGELIEPVPPALGATG
jgi:Family of unknown function (DUF6262)